MSLLNKNNTQSQSFKNLSCWADIDGSKSEWAYIDGFLSWDRNSQGLKRLYRGLFIKSGFKLSISFIVEQARSQGGSGGSADPSLRTKGPLFGTSRVKLLRLITING